ncbi:MAG: DNA cytosine methyltransferase [Bacteroidota bacterium]
MSRQKRKLKVLDLFAGAGGFGLGFWLADNFKVICSLEVDKWAVDTLKANNVEKQKIIQQDIREFKTREQILSACPSKPDVIIGGPPCQGFSNAGSGRKDKNDPRNSLFRNYAQWVEVLEPKVFIMENVRGLLTGKNEKGEKVIEIIKSAFQAIGYTVKVWELNAANYGVPQNRERIFIVGNKVGVEISEPPVTHYLPSEKKMLNGKAKTLKQAINVQRAIGDLPKLKAGQGEEETAFKTKPRTDFQKASRGGIDTLYNHVTMVHTKRVVERYEQILSGLTLEEIPEEFQVRKRNGNGELSETEYNSNYRHLKPDMIAYTIPASFYSNFVHPKQPRNITSREAARLQSFPDSYVFKGKRTQISSKLLKQLGKEDENFLSQYNQIGNAVPPLLAKAVATRIFHFIEETKKMKKRKSQRNSHTHLQATQADTQTKVCKRVCLSQPEKNFNFFSPTL